MKIPEQAEKVFSGVIFDVYHWDQEMFDGTTEKFEMLKRPDTIQVIASMDDKVVIIHEEQPTIPAGYSIVGGRKDEGEDPLTCAKRELLEETGLASDDWELLTTYEPYNKIEWVVHRYVARNCKKISEQNLDAGEKIETKLVMFDEFMDLIIQDSFRSQDVTAYILKKAYMHELQEFKNLLFKK